MGGEEVKIYADELLYDFDELEEIPQKLKRMSDTQVFVYRKTKIAIP